MSVGCGHILFEGQISISKVSKNSIYITMLYAIQHSGSSLRKNFIAKEEVMSQLLNVCHADLCQGSLWKQTAWDKSYNRSKKCCNFVKRLKQHRNAGWRQKRHGCFQWRERAQTSRLASNTAVMDVWQTQKTQWQEDHLWDSSKGKKMKSKVWSIWGECQKKAFKNYFQN